MLDISNVIVQKRMGATEPFSRSKLLKSIRKATVSELPPAELNEVVDKIVQTLVVEELATPPPDGTSPPLPSSLIGETVLRVLRDEHRLQAVQVRYALLFEAARGSFTDAASFHRWMVRHELVPLSRDLVPPEPQWVVKRDGSIAPFVRQKLEDSIRFAAKKKPTEEEQPSDEKLGEKIADEVLKSVRQQRIVTSGQLATEVMRTLRSGHIDDALLSRGERELAYLRVASTAKGFSRADDFAFEARALCTPV